MKKTEFSTLKEAILYCIERENLSYKEYSNYAINSINVSRKMTWQQLANDELRHRTLLTALLKKCEILNLIKPGMLIPKLSPVAPVESLYSIKGILQHALNCEIESYNAYFELASKISEPEIHQLFTLLSEEELAHKYMLEIELKNLK